MTLETLAAALDGQIASAGRVDLSDRALGVPGVDALIASSALAGRALVVETTIPTQRKGEAVSVAGVVSFLNAEKMTATVVFRVVEEGIHFRLEAAWPARWSLDKSFTVLEHADLAEIPLSDGRFVFVTSVSPSLGPSDDLAPGLNLSARLAPGALFSSAASFFDSAWPDELKLQGAVFVSESRLDINLTARLQAPASVGSISLSGGYGRLRILGMPDEEPDAAGANAWLIDVGAYVGATFKLKGRPIDVTARLTPSGRIYLDATGLDHGLANLDDLSDLLGAGTTWQSLWPSQLSLKGLPVSLGRVSVVTDLALSKTTVRLSIVSLTVEVDIGEREKPLCAVPGTTFTLKNIVATWQWLPQSGDYFIRVVASTEPAPGYALDVTFGSDFVITGTFVSKTPLTLATIGEPLLGTRISLPDSLARVGLERLTASIDVNNKSVAIAADVAAHTPICDSFALEQVHLDLRYVEGGTPAVHFLALLQVAEAHFTVTADLDHDLTFALRMRDGDRVKVADLARSILNGSLSLPVDGPELTLEGLRLSVTPSTGNFQVKGTLSGACEFGVLGEQLTLESASLDVTKDRDTFKGAVNLQAHFDLAVSKADASGHSTSFRFTPESIDFTKNADGMSMHARARLQLLDLGDPLTRVLPARVIDDLKTEAHAEFDVSTKGVTLTVDRLPGIAEPLPIPAAGQIKDFEGRVVGSFDLGVAAIKASNFTLTLGTVPSLSVDVGLALPSRLNGIFGASGPGVFEVYDEVKQTGFMTLGASLSTSGLSAVLKDGFPFKAMDVRDGKWNVTLGANGEYGEFSIDVPVLRYTGATFKASGGYHLNPQKPPAIPMQPLQQLLTQAGFEDIARTLPHKVPVPLELSLIEKAGPDKKDWKLKVPEIMQVLHGALPQSTDLGAIEQALTRLSALVHMLPAGLCEYLDLRAPESLSFTLTVSPDGGVSFALETTGEPIRILYPVPTLPFPALQGVTIRAASFGEVLGGSLLLLTLTADFDRFDVLSLADSLAFQQVPVLPVTRDFHSQVIVRDLYCFVIYQTGVPIPIPAFYGELGVDYLGVQGVSVQAHVHFAKPSPSLTDLADAGRELYAFFTDKTARLEEAAPPKILPTFTLEDCYIKLPAYLGGKVLGHEGLIADVDFNRVFAHLMNGVKFMTLADLLAVIPIEYRVNREHAAVKVDGFSCLSMQASWLISTPEEFAGPESAYTRIGIKSQGEAEELLGVAPGTVKRDSSGLVVILRGDWQVLGTGFDTYFVLVAQDTRTFATGFRFDGTLLSGLVTAHFAGHLDVGPQLESLHGEARLALLDNTLFTGTFDATGKGFTFDGSVQLFPRGFPVNVTGHASGKSTPIGVSFSGGLGAQLGFIALSGAISVDAGTDHLGIHGTWASYGDVALRLVNTNGNLKGSFSVGFGLAVDVLITPGKGAVLTLSTGSATVHFTAPSDIAGSFSKASGSRYGLDVAGYRLTEGSIIWNNDRFALAGGVNFGLVKADVTGGLGAEGLSLSGRYEVGVTLPTIGLLGVAVRIDISQQGVGVRLTLPGKIENQGAIAVFGKKLCTLVHLSTPLKDFWLAIPLGGLPVVYWSRPAGWPLDGAAPVRAAAPMAVRVAYASPAHVGANLSALSLPDSVTPLPHRDVTGALLDAVAVALGGGETSEQGSESIFQTLEAYRASSGDAGGPVTGGRWVTVCRSEAHEDFFTESVTRVGAGDLNVATASATFEQHGASPGGPGLTMTLQVLLKGQNASAVVTLDPKDLSGAYRAIAEQLRSS